LLPLSIQISLNMKKKFLFLSILLSFGSILQAQIHCPDDITVSCLSDLTPDECGMANVVSGNYYPSMLKFEDDDQTNACNEGNVLRRFYLDADFSNTFTENEPFCIQTITLEYDRLPLNVQFPPEREFSCLDDIPVESPTWSINPCDLVGFTYEDETFEFEAEACLKIVRHYRVINWCIYDEAPAEGLIEGTQVIKIVDKMAPEIENCEDAFFDAGSNCETMVTLSNAATDMGDCPSGTLTWRVSVDLWGNGDEDLFYGPNEPATFRIDPVQNGEEVQIVIPEALGVSKNKVDWKVTDGCGNVRTCSTEFFIEDNKPPTPYCLNFTSATLNGDGHGQLTIPASFFNVEAVDNCSASENIILSFSENVEDDERIIECGDTGLRFFRIYYTDEEGNQDFCEVFMLIFDNGTCFGRFAPDGLVSTPAGQALAGVDAYLMMGEDIITAEESDTDGYFTFGEQALMEDYYATLKYEATHDEAVDLEDFMLMRSALLGLESLDFYQQMAADIDGDGSFTADDLYAFREVLLGNSAIEREDIWKFVPAFYQEQSIPNLNMSSNIMYTQYNEGFDFYGIRTGDLTGSKMITVEEVEDDNRSVRLTLEVNNDGFVIRSNEDLSLDGYQFDLTDPSIQLIPENADSRLQALGATRRLLNLTPAAKNTDDILISGKGNITTANPMDLLESAKIYTQKANRPVNIIWNVIDRRSSDYNTIDKKSLALRVYPTPFREEIMVMGQDIQQISMYTISGQAVAIQSNISDSEARIIANSDLPSGVYFLKVTTSKGEQMIRVVK